MRLHDLRRRPAERSRGRRLDVGSRLEIVLLEDDNIVIRARQQ
jgi:hypothetical protein